ELRQLQKEIGITTVFVTHDQEEALTLSDQVAIMNAGKIEQMGTPRELYERPATDFVANFLGVSNIFDGRVTGREGGDAVVAIGPLQVRVPWEDGIQSDAAIRVAVRPEKIRLGRPGEKDGLPAYVRHIVYLGGSTHLYLERPEGTPVIVHVQNIASDTVPWTPGDEVTCHLAANSVFVLRKG
ncbi:MAG TPA: ABC transporter ATP-binding protein, partial [Candidatus Acidoferrum sp.]|nr:ABC transporter ATP-binding protein [Candidatus Acidoferrum sp.]